MIVNFFFLKKNCFLFENNSLDSAFMQNSTMSLPNRSHSVTEIPTINGDQRPRSSGLIHSNSTTNNNNSLLYQRSLSYVKTINDYHVEPSQTMNGDHSFRTDKYNIVSNLFFQKTIFFYVIFFLS
jgi:hypothetical protein